MIQEQLVTEDEPIVAEVGRKQALRKTFSESAQLLNLYSLNAMNLLLHL